MSILLALIHRNVPLHRCKEFKTEKDLEKAFGIHFGAHFSERDSRRLARRIVNALSQVVVAEQLAKEWNNFPSRLRMDITDIANDGGQTGNVSKGVAYANQLLGGKLLREETCEPTERRLVTGLDGKLASVRRRVDPAKAYAQALYGNTQRPANYSSLPKRERKRIDRELTEARREMLRQK